VARLGVSSLVREALQAGTPGELARYVYSYGGAPLASLRPPFRGGSTAARVERLLLGGAGGQRGGTEAGGPRTTGAEEGGGEGGDGEGGAHMPGLSRRLLASSMLSLHPAAVCSALSRATSSSSWWLRSAAGLRSPSPPPFG
jgi:hypothetical protein